MKKTIFLLLLAVCGLSVWHLRPVQKEMAVSWEDEALRVELAGRLELAKFRLAAAGEVRGPEDLERVVTENEARETRISDLKVKRGELTAAIRQVDESFVKFNVERLRELKARAVGKEWAELATAGRTYQDVKVVAVTDAGVTIRHRDGSARLRYHDLTDRQRQDFGLVEGAALAAVQEERQKSAAYEQWLEDELAAMERDKRDAAKVFAKATQVKRTPAPVVSSNVPPVRPLAEPARQVGIQYGRTSYSRPRRTSFYYYYSAPRYCAPSYRISASGPYGPARPYVNNRQ